MVGYYKLESHLQTAFAVCNYFSDLGCENEDQSRHTGAKINDHIFLDVSHFLY